MATSTEDKLVRVSIGGRVRAVRIRRSIFKIHSTRTGRSRTVETAVIPLTMVVAAAKSLKEPLAPPPTYGPSLRTTLQVQTAAPHNQQMPCKATNPHYLWNHPPISDPTQEPPTNQWGQPPTNQWGQPSTIPVETLLTSCCK